MPAADREWFAAHPRAHRRRRPISPAEITELRLAGYLPDGWTAAGDIEVVQLAPGVRTRALRDVWIFPRVGAA